jgi:hypothetical protein
MRSRGAIAVSLLVALALGGCVLLPVAPAEDAGSSRAPGPAPTTTSGYTFDPVSTMTTSVGWPSDVGGLFYLVSEPVNELCHVNEATFLFGESIVEEIPLTDLEGIDGLACGFTATAGSDDPDLLDEVAWRVDEGLPGLLSAYAATASDGASLGCESAEVPLALPGISVQYGSTWFVLTPGKLACTDTLASIEASAASLQLTELLRHTTTFEEYEAAGF